ncbi:MAG: hypothetical protein R3E87_25630 [Burkholderiaceae bacterium]
MNQITMCAGMYTGRRFTRSREDVGTCHVAALVRVLVDPRDDDDVATVHALQDAVKVRQCAPGSLSCRTGTMPPARAARDALLVLARGLHDTRRTFGARE